jgi:hypothetical protein
MGFKNNFDFDSISKSLARVSERIAPPPIIENPVIKSSERSADALEQLIKNQELERQARIKAEHTAKIQQLIAIAIGLFTLAATIIGIVVK